MLRTPSSALPGPFRARIGGRNSRSGLVWTCRIRPTPVPQLPDAPGVPIPAQYEKSGLGARVSTAVSCGWRVEGESPALVPWSPTHNPPLRYQEKTVEPESQTRSESD